MQSYKKDSLYNMSHVCNVHGRLVEMLYTLFRLVKGKTVYI